MVGRNTAVKQSYSFYTSFVLGLLMESIWLILKASNTNNMGTAWYSRKGPMLEVIIHFWSVFPLLLLSRLFNRYYQNDFNTHLLNEHACAFMDSHTILQLSSADNTLSIAILFQKKRNLQNNKTTVYSRTSHS